MKNKKAVVRLLKPLIWIISKFLGLIPSYGNATKAINGEREIRKLEKISKFAEARKLRTELLSMYPLKHLGPLWRSEGMDQLYNLKNYHKALKAFENAISCIEGESMICAFQYGVTDPFQVYYGAAAAAIRISDGEKAKVYYENFRDLVSRSTYKDRFQDHIDWLSRQIGDSETQENFIN
jgi:tetratricopeptide (TPR) repeat protein